MFQVVDSFNFVIDVEFLSNVEEVFDIRVGVIVVVEDFNGFFDFV